MSLQVTNLTRFYGKQKALDAISFSVKAGEIVGFLGPNGAGKSTTMKIIAGYLLPSEGRVMVEGLDVREKPLATKRRIGYLPEHNPLYLDMYVREYLHFVGHIYGMDRHKRRQCVEEVVAQCGLTQEQKKKIGALSKGYKQRVGLAQALLHDPTVLILDEPTSGLDPNQIVEIRNMIKHISQNKTVLFSTHIMQEVQALCDRVIIVNKGKIIADNSISVLLAAGNYADTLVVHFQEKIDQTALAALPGLDKVVLISDYEFQLVGQPGVNLKEVVVQYAAAKKLGPITLKEDDHRMEHIFRSLTAKNDD